MTGWTGGAANRSWKRDQRSPEDGRLSPREDVARILANWRAARGWKPGKIWDPYHGTYVERT